MRILYLAPAHSAQDRLATYTFLHEEILALADSGHDVYTVTFGNPGATPGRQRIHPLLVRSGTVREKLTTLLRVAGILGPRPSAWRQPLARLHAARIEFSLYPFLRQENIEVIHSHFGWPGGWGGALLARATSLPLVATMRGMDLQMDETLGYGLRLDTGYESALHVLFRRADVTTYASRSMRERGIQFGADPARARIIWKGVDVEQFTPVPDRDALKADLQVSGPLVLTVANLLPLKGVDTVLRALSALVDVDFTFVICGDGSERARLERLAISLGLGERVRLIGRVPRAEIPRYFAACDVFVLGSRIEAAGNVILEAMAAGRPVVTTDSGGPGEYVVDGTTGFVVPVDDAGALGKRIAQLLNGPDLAEAMGAAGRRRVESQHAYGQMIRGFEDAYHAAIAHHRRGGATLGEGSDAEGLGAA